MTSAKPISHPGPLSRWELAWAGAAFAGLFPRGAHAELPLGADDVAIAPEIQSLLSAAPSRAVWGVRVAIVLCALAPIVLLGRLRTIAGLDAPAKTRVMATLLASSLYPVRQLALLLKMMGSFAFARAPEVRAVMLRPRVAPPPLESGPRLIDQTSLVRRREAAGAERASRSGTEATDGRRIA
jgi:hypothetical protein